MDLQDTVTTTTITTYIPTSESSYDQRLLYEDTLTSISSSFNERKGL